MKISALLRKRTASAWPPAGGAVLALMLCFNAQSFEVTVSSVDDRQCDTLIVPVDVDELGPGAVFPDDETVAFDPATTEFQENCSGVTAGEHFTMILVNDTGRAFDEVWFVADTINYWIGNYDGFVNDAPAMKIDTEGVNKPLTGESMTADGILEVGEVWRFDVFNWVGPFPVLGSLGRVGEPSLTVEDSSASIIATPIAPPQPSSALQCFYECKLTPDGGLYAEVTTLMIANGNPPPAPFVHIPTHVASAVILDGNERVLGLTHTRLSGRDLDELAVCATLEQAEIFPPPAGSIQVAITSIPGAPPGDTSAVHIWMKNVVGRMNFGEPEPFRGRVTGVGKTACRIIPGDIASGTDLLNDPEVGSAPLLEPVLIEQTGE